MLIEATDQRFTSLIAGQSIDGFSVAPGGLEREAILTMLHTLAQKVGASLSPAAWLMVEQEEIVGLCSLITAPDPLGAVEIGYGVAESRRGAGIASRAIAELVAWAARERSITSLIAKTTIDNLPSQKVLQHNGFRQIGHLVDAEDGELICWHLDIAAGGAPSTASKKITTFP